MQAQSCSLEQSQVTVVLGYSPGAGQVNSLSACTFTHGFGLEVGVLHPLPSRIAWTWGV